MNPLTQLVAVLATLAHTTSSVVNPPGVTDTGNFELLILHNNDMHARFEQTSQLSGACTVADREAGKCYGGFPRVAHVVKEARRAAASGEGPPVLYLNAGDTYTGTAWFTIYKWKIAAEFVNALQPDAVSLGNNEIEKGSNELSPFLENLETTILSSNVILRNADPTQKIKKSVIIDIKGTKVGVVGFLTPEMAILDCTGDVEYIDEVLALKEEVTRLQEQNVNIIIALGHSSEEKCMEIAKQVEEIDLIMSGHKNKFFWNGTVAEGKWRVADSIIVGHKSGKQVPIISSYAYDKYLGRLLTTFDGNFNIIDYSTDPILLDDNIPQEPDTLQMVQKLFDEISPRSDEVIGQTAVLLDGVSCRLEECNLGNLITDAMMYHYAIRFEGERWTDAPVAVIPGGHIAASISPSNRPADVTRADLLTALPVESHIVAVTMTGTVLLQMLEHSTANYSHSNPSGQLLQMSGIRVVYDMSRESGSRVVSAVVRCWACFVPEFYDIDDWRPYKILMPVALADGEFGYSMLTGLPREEVIYDEVTCTAEFIGLRSPVYPEVAGRIGLQNLEAIEEEVEEPEPETDSATSILCSTLILFVAFVPYFIS